MAKGAALLPSPPSTGERGENTGERGEKTAFPESSALARSGGLLLLSVTWLLILASSASACNVPVFRYALERWKPEPYQVVLFHRGPLDKADTAIADSLAQYVNSEACTSNLTFTQVDLGQQPDDEMLQIFEPYAQARRPWLVVRYPVGAGIKRTIWAGPLTSPMVLTLLDSPIRRELTKRILGGESAVWLLLESGKKEQDDAAFDRLEKELRALEKSLKLRDLTDAPEDKLLIKDGPPLRIAFSILRVSRTAAAEKLLVGTLLNCENDLLQRVEPMVFPIFGRGHCLMPLIGRGIRPDVIQPTAGAIVSYCQDSFRSEQPFVDLLMTADWEALVQGRRVRDPELPALSSLGAAPAEVVTTSAETSTWESERESTFFSFTLGRNLTLAALVGLVLGGGLILVLWKRAQS
jgi:hypothetical protein